MYTLECRKYSQIVDWAPSGLAFVVMDKACFENIVLPEIFKEARYSSFERKLKRWGFVKAKVDRGTMSSCYGHHMFRRGDYDLCSKIDITGDQKTLEIQFACINFCPPPSTSIPCAPSQQSSSSEIVVIRDISGHTSSSSSFGDDSATTSRSLKPIYPLVVVPAPASSEKNSSPVLFSSSA